MLFVLSKLYSGVIDIRNSLYDSGLLATEKLPCPVISIGNLCVGGTGKTPLTIHIAKTLKNKGCSVCVISRGYKGTAEQIGGMVSDGKRIIMSPFQAGDEPYMMAETLPGVPVFVGKKRFLSGKEAVSRFKPDVIILDDGFQHRKLHRDVDLLLLDYNAPFGNHKILPAGRLREPVSGISRSTAVIFTRSDEKPENFNRIEHATIYGIENRPIFYSTHIPYVKRIVFAGKNQNDEMDRSEDENRTELLAGRRVVAFSGIADNEQFKNTLASLSSRIIEFHDFPDHHAYSKSLLESISEKAVEANADFLVTTQKDYVKLDDFAWPLDLVVIDIKISMGEDDLEFTDFLLKSLKR